MHMQVKYIYVENLDLLTSLGCIHYLGNLTAIITRPKLDKHINNAEDLLNQDDIYWSIGEGYGVGESMRQAPVGSTPRSLIDRGENGIYLN